MNKKGHLVSRLPQTPTMNKPKKVTPKKTMVKKGGGFLSSLKGLGEGLGRAYEAQQSINARGGDLSGIFAPVQAKPKKQKAKKKRAQRKSQAQGRSITINF